MKKSDSLVEVGDIVPAQYNITYLSDRPQFVDIMPWLFRDDNHLSAVFEKLPEVARGKTRDVVKPFRKTGTVEEGYVTSLWGVGTANPREFRPNSTQEFIANNIRCAVTYGPSGITDELTFEQVLNINRNQDKDFIIQHLTCLQGHDPGPDLANRLPQEDVLRHFLTYWRWIVLEEYQLRGNPNVRIY